jgi:hypothetical protein
MKKKICRKNMNKKGKNNVECKKIGAAIYDIYQNRYGIGSRSGCVGPQDGRSLFGIHL